MHESKIVSLVERRQQEALVQRATAEVKWQEQIHEMRLIQNELLVRIDDLEVQNQELESSNRKYQELYDFAPIAYLSLDRTGVIIDINQTGADMLGDSKSAFHGKPLFLYVDQDSRMQLADHIAAVLEGKAQSLEIKLRGPTGPYPVCIDSVPVLSAEGFVTACSSVVTDVSERRRAEQVLKSSKQRFRDFANVAADWFWELDADLRYTYVSEGFSEDIGREPAEVIGLTRQEVFRGQMQDAKSWECHFRGLNAGQAVTFDYELITAAKKSKTYILEEGKPIYDASGAFLGYRGVGRNITKRREAEHELETYKQRLEEQVAERTKELRAAIKESEAFSYSVSHDLRAPLRAIDGFSHVLLEDYGERLDESGRNLLDRVRGASQRMGELIDDMLLLSRITRRDIHYQRVDMSELARQISFRLREVEPGRKVKFNISRKLIGFGDAHLLQVVLENLLSNAMKYTAREAKAVVEFGAEEHANENIFFVKDNGVGFDMQYIDKLFGPFERLHMEDEFEGSGIGLATVARVMQRHNGRVWAESKLDEGACFYFALPIENLH